jgi:hypothetical protein
VNYSLSGDSTGPEALAARAGVPASAQRYAGQCGPLVTSAAAGVSGWHTGAFLPTKLGSIPYFRPGPGRAGLGSPRLPVAACGRPWLRGAAPRQSVLEPPAIGVRRVPVARFPLLPLDLFRRTAPGLLVQSEAAGLEVSGAWPLVAQAAQPDGATEWEAVWCSSLACARMPRFQMVVDLEPLLCPAPAPPPRPLPGAETLRRVRAFLRASRATRARWMGAALAGLLLGAGLCVGIEATRGENLEMKPASGAGSLVSLRRSIANRAASEVTDTFHSGMKSWGVTSGYAPGWAPNPEGWVRVGALALLQPTASARDYRLEFLGQIDEKGMGWVVRARDARNFHAMKLKVLQDGPRMVLAMVHYEVVGGKQGPRVETPLSVMVHRNQAYQVDVDVTGNRVATLFDGQPVDAWIDGLNSAGGVGFFSDKGERARLYWVRVLRNQDLLGRVCARLARALGQGTAATAPGATPRQVPEIAVCLWWRRRWARGAARKDNWRTA